MAAFFKSFFFPSVKAQDDEEVVDIQAVSRVGLQQNTKDIMIDIWNQIKIVLRLCVG